MKSLLLTLLPLCSAQSHVLVSIGGSSYAHGAKVEQPSLAPVVASYPTTPAPVYHNQPSTVYLTKATTAPHYPVAAPVHKQPTYHSTLSYHKVPQKQYQPSPQYQISPKYHQPPPQYTQTNQYLSTPHYQAAPKHHSTKQNCTVVDEVIKTEVCTPAFETKCANIDLKVKIIVDKEQCQNITRTVCSAAEEVIDNKICVYSYERQSEDTVAKTVKVTFAKECSSKRVTVCQQAQEYSYQSYGQQYCKEVDQETCYNLPTVTPVDTKVSVIFPSPLKTCSNKPISITKISCEDLIEEKCIKVPQIEEKTEKVEKCEVTLAKPSCQEISLTLPKQVCVGLVHGHTVDLTAQEYHAKV